MLIPYKKAHVEPMVKHIICSSGKLSKGLLFPYFPSQDTVLLLFSDLIILFFHFINKCLLRICYQAGIILEQLQDQW